MATGLVSTDTSSVTTGSFFSTDSSATKGSSSATSVSSSSSVSSNVNKTYLRRKYSFPFIGVLGVSTA